LGLIGLRISPGGHEHRRNEKQGSLFGPVIVPAAMEGYQVESSDCLTSQAA
jgi:hypothetical protein